MSARVLTAYLVSIGLLAVIISQALAKPPDLPAKTQINCEKSSAKMVLKTYQVADLVIPVEGLPEGLPWAEVAVPVSLQAAQYPIYAPIPAPMPAPAYLVPPPAAATGPVPPPIGYMPVPMFPTPAVYSAQVPAKASTASVTTTEPTKPNHPCCPACPNGKCVECPASYGLAATCDGTACYVPQVPRKTLEGQLIRLIVSTVKPESWDVNGGRGTIDFFPLGLALTVNQTPDVQEMVATLLEDLRRLQDEQIAVEVRVISVPQGFGQKVACKVAMCAEKCDKFCTDIVINVKETASGSVLFGTGVNSDAGLTGSCCVKESSSCPECCSKECQDAKPMAKLSFLSEAQVKKLMEALQANPKTNVMMVPKMTVFNGQAGNIQVNDQQFFVTNMKMMRQGDQQVFLPENHPFETGTRFSVKPRISADHRFIQMGVEAEETTLDTASDHVPLFPVTTSITPISEDGSKCEPVPFTMYLQQPSLVTQRIHQEVCVPCGQTALFKAWTNCTEVRDESAFPVLSSLPYIGDMFKNVSYHQQTSDVWVMITARLINSKDLEMRPPVAAHTSPTVTDNLQRLTHARSLYEQAENCRKQGHTETARHIYENVQDLCPGSRYAQLASRRLSRLSAQQAARAPEKVIPSPMPVSEEVYTILNGNVVTNHMPMKDPDKKIDPKVLEYLASYWEACAEGNMAKATNFAVQALALDPACFSKARNAVWLKESKKAVAPSAN